MTKYILAIAAGTAGAYFLAEPVEAFFADGDSSGAVVGKKLGGKLTIALATGGVGAAVACLVVK